MRRQVVVLAKALCVMALVAGCGAHDSVGLVDGSGPRSVQDAVVGTPAWPGRPGVSLGDQPPLWWPVSSDSELTPTGIEVVGRSWEGAAVEGLVVDGSGAVWVDGAWQLARVDPSTGHADVWDVGDDFAFGSIEALRPSAGAGVWLVDGGRLRLFDGTRFVRDLQVPETVRGGSPVTDMVEVGSEVWISSPVGVARCAEGSWSMVRPGQLTSAGPLAVDSERHVWTSGRIRAGESYGRWIVRFDGVEWRTPDPPGPTGIARNLVADPTGGIFVRLGMGVHHFDGSSWGDRMRILGWGDIESLAVTDDGALWLLGDEVIARRDASGDWSSVEVGEESPFDFIAGAGVHALVLGSQGLARVEGDRLASVWSPAGAGPSDEVLDALAVSAHELWAVSGSAVWRFHKGRWDSVWRQEDPFGMSGWGIMMRHHRWLALASDGAVWASTQDGLVRFVGGRPEVLSATLSNGWVVPGTDRGAWVFLPGGSWWEDRSDEVSLVGPGGLRQTVRLPVDPSTVMSIAAGDGVLWVLTGSSGQAGGAPAPTLLRWDGRWSPVPYPGEALTGMQADPRGGLWAEVQPLGTPSAGAVVARYEQGTWTLFPDAGSLSGVAPAPGALCGTDDSATALVCVDAAGGLTQQAIGPPGRTSIAPDGSVWLVDRGLIARLPITAPG
jgi:hypothetical protein